MEQRKRLSRIVYLASLVAIIVGGWWAVVHRQDIADWWKLRDYMPSAAIVQIADATSMIGRGRDMFYVSDPRIEDKTTFNQNCNNAAVGEQGAVLGCYALQNIHIYNVDDARLPGVKEVTAAHEMLHAAYERLDTQSKNRIDALLQAEMDKRANDTELQKVIQLYQKAEPGEILNEMHSILATEYDGLAPDLEQYFTQYFQDRGRILSLSQGYKAVFVASKARIVDYQQQLDGLKQQIDANTVDLDQRNVALQSDSSRLTSLRQSDTALYNREVPRYNTKVSEYNRIARATQALVDQYNAIIPKIQNEIAQQNDLNNSLNSKYQPVPTQ